MESLLIISLFRLIEVSKNLGVYPAANWAFRVLLSMNYEAKKPLLVTEVETESEREGFEYPFVYGKGYYIDHHNSYYDLLVLRYEAEYACIPMPLVEENNPLWYALERAVFKDKLPHERITIWDKIKALTSQA